jgi:hypothetical protein
MPVRRGQESPDFDQKVQPRQRAKSFRRWMISIVTGFMGSLRKILRACRVDSRPYGKRVVHRQIIKKCSNINPAEQRAPRKHDTCFHCHARDPRRSSMASRFRYCAGSFAGFRVGSWRRLLTFRADTDLRSTQDKRPAILWSQPTVQMK